MTRGLTGACGFPPISGNVVCFFKKTKASVQERFGGNWLPGLGARVCPTQKGSLIALPSQKAELQEAVAINSLPSAALQTDYKITILRDISFTEEWELRAERQTGRTQIQPLTSLPLNRTQCAKAQIITVIGKLFKMMQTSYFLPGAARTRRKEPRPVQDQHPALLKKHHRVCLKIATNGHKAFIINFLSH